MKFVMLLSNLVPPFTVVLMLLLSIITQLPLTLMDLVNIPLLTDVLIQMLPIITLMPIMMMDLVPSITGVLTSINNVMTLLTLSTKMMVILSVLGKVPLIPL